MKDNIGPCGRVQSLPDIFEESIQIPSSTTPGAGHLQPLTRIGLDIARENSSYISSIFTSSSIS